MWVGNVLTNLTLEEVWQLLTRVVWALLDFAFNSAYVYLAKQ